MPAHVSNNKSPTEVDKMPPAMKNKVKRRRCPNCFDATPPNKPGMVSTNGFVEDTPWPGTTSALWEFTLPSSGSYVRTRPFVKDHMILCSRTRLRLGPPAACSGLHVCEMHSLKGPLVNLWSTGSAQLTCGQKKNREETAVPRRRSSFGNNFFFPLLPPATIIVCSSSEFSTGF